MKSQSGGPKTTGSIYGGYNGNITGPFVPYADPDGTELVAAWDCHESCPVRLLDEQSGTLKPATSRTRRAVFSQFKRSGDLERTSVYPDTGGASRFFYTAKASRAERNAGLEGMPERIASVGNHEAAGRDGTNPKNYVGGKQRRVEQGLTATEPRANHHPTVKPLTLIRWLVRLITPPGGIVLDPFLGSGTTLVACELEGFDGIGIELSEEYAEIARRRLAATVLPLFASVAAD